MYIYKITNKITNQSYVGQTNDFKRRKENHISLYKSPDSKGANRPLYRAMRSYGLDKFSFDILEECDKENSNEREEYYIQLYNCVDKGYNREKNAKRKDLSLETKNKIKLSQLGIKNHMYGKTGKMCKNSKKVINLKTRKVYNSMRECALDEYGDIKYVKYISRICDVNSNRFTYKGNEYRLIDKNGNIINKKRFPKC